MLKYYHRIYALVGGHTARINKLMEQIKFDFNQFQNN